MQQLRLLSALLGLFLFTHSAFGQNCRELQNLPKSDFEPVIIQITKEEFEAMSPPKSVWGQMKGKFNCIEGNLLFVRTLSSIEFRAITPPGVEPVLFIQVIQENIKGKAIFYIKMRPL